MTTQLVRDSMKLMADAGVDIVDIKWFDLTGAFSEHQHANLEPVQEPVAVVSGYYGGQCVVLPTNPARLFNSGTAFYTAPPAQPAVPDAFGTREGEHPQYIQGWNDCRAEMLREFKRKQT